MLLAAAHYVPLDFLAQRQALPEDLIVLLLSAFPASEDERARFWTCKKLTEKLTKKLTDAHVYARYMYALFKM